MVDDLLGALPAGLVLVVVAALVVAEGALLAGLVLPSATALVALGLLANEGVVGIVPAVLVAVAAALLGGSGGYFAGRRKPVRRARGRHWPRAEKIFGRYGGGAVFFGQWVAGTRTLMPRLAASRGVPYRRFVAFHSPAAVGWSLWLVLGSYAAGASYDVLAARAGRAGGALAVLTCLLAALVLAGHRLGRHPLSLPAWPPLAERADRTVRLSAGLGALVVAAALLAVVIPLIVELSGLSAADEAVARWARDQWTSDGYRFALELATKPSPELLLAVAGALALGLAWWRRTDLLDALAPLAPPAVLMVVLAVAAPPSWQSPPEVVLPSAAEYDGPLPLAGAGAAPAGLATAQTAQLAVLAGLLAWQLGRRLAWPHRVAVGTAAAALLTVCAGSWVYLGWSRLSETIAAVLLGGAWAVLNGAVWQARSTRPEALA
ncbi:DedA family protein [Actinoplanes sp. URMC 104]|uniref:DedA family protein n=1 Tax=Actinoplanes sp. URMC 104 TaxID=3423409 RepID=UPI003F1D8682